MDYYRLLSFRGFERGWYGGGFHAYQGNGDGRLDHRNLNEVVSFNPTAENIARWVCEQIPTCFKVEVRESEGNTVIYEKD